MLALQDGAALRTMAASRGLRRAAPNLDSLARFCPAAQGQQPAHAPALQPVQATLVCSCRRH